MRDRASAQQPPAAVSAEEPTDIFSAMGAMKHVEAIARKPHPLGSDAAEPVRAYIMAELKALGFEPEIQQPHDARPTRSRVEIRSLPARRAEHRRPMARHGAGREEGAVALGPL